MPVHPYLHVQRFEKGRGAQLPSRECFLPKHLDLQNNLSLLVADWATWLSLFIYIRGWWRTQVRGPSVWMLCSVRSLCRPLSWLSTNQRRPPPLNQSQRPFPLSWRDVECADVEPCNSILLSKSSRSFLWNWKYTRTFYFLHTFLLNKKSSYIQLLDFGGLGCPFPGCQGVVLDQQHWWWSCVPRCSTAAPSLLWSCPPPSTCQELPAAAVVKQILHQQTWDYANKTTSSQQWEFEDFRVSYNKLKDF